jgi:predicted solute-binding protein
LIRTLTVKLLLHDTITTAPLVYPFQAGWVDASDGIELHPSLTAADIDGDTSALIPSAEIPLLTETHLVVPDVAVVLDGRGDVAMRTPVRPDEIEGPVVRLYETSGTSELLARATLESFYGIVAREWTGAETADAQVVIVEGAEALRPPEGGFTEDLVRAWFILTAQPLVSHLLIVPKSADPEPVRELMTAARTIGHERRKDLRRATAERFEIDREHPTELAAVTRLSLEEADRRALLMFLQRGNRGSAYPYVWEIPYTDSPASDV